jgi:hypothetical protein
VEIASLKPRLFIGSSREGSEVAHSIQANLDRVAECSVWDQGVFELSDVALQRLIQLVETSDFGVFVCSADDTSTMRGRFNTIVRDNVVFELGMFMGYLGLQRTFFLVPQDFSDLHLPTDLSGITYETYDAKRRDGDLRQATAPFCRNVRKKVESEGFRRKKQHARLDNLAVAYACCEWIPDKEPYAGVKRGERKNQIFDEIVEECRREPPNKLLLASHGLDVLSDPAVDYIASKIRVFASIDARPELSDVDLILGIRLSNLPDGNARIRSLYAARKVADAFQNEPKLQGLRAWQSIASTEHYVRDAQKLLLQSLDRAKSTA